ncbi:serine hydrolase [Lentibacillus sp. CBA3610]|uniref:serine hydrolase n=1 Tax=Lentibacillus sp. CBA3610 TaxID=2518176 RepID=UPI0015950CF9|nr:serine hydrolase [Lentibacillus sp. CBA3610]
MTISQLENDINSLLDGMDSPVGLSIKEGDHSITVNANMSMPAASVIKIPIIMEAFRRAQNGDLNLFETISVPADAIVGGSGFLQALSEDVSMTLLDVLTLMVIVSDNTASNLVLKRVGIHSVNTLCRQLQCHDTKIQRYFMDMKAAEDGPENTTTADDMNKFLEEISTPKLLSKKSANHILQIMTHQQLTAKLPAYHTNNELIIANKTGELMDAEHDVGIFRYQDRTVLASVMISGINDRVAAQLLIAGVGNRLWLI